MSKPVVAFLAGRLAPPGKKMGHAGAIIASPDEGYAAKVAVLEEAGVHVVRRPYEIAPKVASLLGESK